MLQNVDGCFQGLVGVVVAMNAATSAQPVVSIMCQGNHCPAATHDCPKQKAMGQASHLSPKNQSQSDGE